MVHEGKILHKLLKGAEIGETKVSNEFSISRRAVYNYYKSENLSNKVKKRFLDSFGIDVNKHIHDTTYPEVDQINLIEDPEDSSHLRLRAPKTLSGLKHLVQDLRRKIDQLESASSEKDKRISSLEEMLKLALKTDKLDLG